MKRTIISLLIQSFIFFLMYLAIIKGVVGARNLVIAVVWIEFINLFLIGINKKLIIEQRKRGRSVPGPIKAMIRSIQVGIFIWHSWFVTGALIFVSMLIGYFIYDLEEEGKNNESVENRNMP